MARAIPTINTARLTLRAMRPQDFEDYVGLWSDASVVEHLGAQPWTRSACWQAFLVHAGHWQMTGFGVWAVEPRGTRKVMGQVGFYFAGRDLGDDFDAYPEASWVLHPDLHGKGYGLEAAAAAHDWFDRVVTGPLVCKLSPDNAASDRVARAMGYKPLRDAEWRGQPSQLMLRKTPPGGPRNLLA